LVRWSRASIVTLAAAAVFVLVGGWTDRADAGAPSDPVVPLSEGFEDGYGQFTSSSLFGGELWRTVDSVAHTGAASIYGEDSAVAGESLLFPMSTLVIPANATAASLTFWHMYDFEAANGVAYDGGVIEVSTDFGETWTDAGANVLLNAYTGTIAEASGTNPLRGRAAWVERAGAWTEVMMDLMPYRGLSLRFRLRLGTDLSNVTSPTGWFVDDVQVSYTAPSTDCGRAWSTVSPYPAELRQASAVGLADRIYAFGGRTGGMTPQTVTSAYSYSTEDDTWAPIAPLPEARSLASVVTDGTSIYILGGYTGANEPTNTLWRYDPGPNIYTTLTPFTTATGGQAAVYLDGLIYRIGGYTGEETNTVEVYSISSNTWSGAENYPVFVSGVSAFAFGGYIFTAGGSDGRDNIADTYRYDPIGDVWDSAPITDLPGRISFTAAALYKDTWILARGGLPFAWTPPANRWRSVDQSPQQVTLTAAAATDTGFYIIGGLIRNELNNTTAVQRYSETDCAAPTPTVTPPGPPGTPTATRTGSAPPGCLGDCEGDGTVAIADLVKGVAIALGMQAVGVCSAMDGDQNGAVAVNELVQAVNNALSACPG
jgi:hypothetical protein